jgi:hypothetical protein
VGGGGDATNPYAASSPAFLPQQLVPHSSSDIVPQRVGVDPIWNYAWRVWQNNLGLLAGTTFVVLLITGPIAFGEDAARDMFRQEGEDALAGLVVCIGRTLRFLVETYLGIGQAIIALKLARGQPAEFSDLFKGGARYLPVLGGRILAGLAIGVGLLLCIVPGVILALMFWPFYYLVVEGKVGVMDSFGMANKITEGNWGTAFLLWLLSIVIGIVGFLAFCIGIVFAIPLITLLWVTAYLMMSGQLAPYPGYGSPPAAAGYGPPAGSPFGGK